MIISRTFLASEQYLSNRTCVRVLLVSAFLGLSACASVPPPATTPSIVEEIIEPVPQPPEMTLDDVALDDLVRALVQYRDPINTTLQASLEMTTGLENEPLLAILSELGYGLQLVDADQGSNLLHHEVDIIQTSESPSRRHTLQVGQLELSREYATLDKITRPISPLRVAGSRRRISLDDSRFGGNVVNDRLVSRIAFSATSEVSPDETPRISLLQLPLGARDKDSNVGTNTSGLEVSNVYFGGDNFGSILDDYSRVETVSVIFPNDSMRLGNIGRLKIDVFLGDFDEESDLIRVVGCSNGATEIEIGNEGLALGRADRVTQELLSRGVTREHILDEGCWGPQPIGERFPSRGVVLELYRTS